MHYSQADSKLTAFILVMFNEGTSLVTQPTTLRAEIRSISVDDLPASFPLSAKTFMKGIQAGTLELPECCSRSHV